MRFLPLFLILFSLHLSAQNRTFTMEDAIQGGRSYLAPESLERLQWIGDSDYFSYIKRADKNDPVGEGDIQLYVANAAQPQKAKAVLSLTEYNIKMNEIYGSKTENGGATTSNSIRTTNFPRIKWISKSTFQFEFRNTVYAFNTKKKSIKALDELEFPNRVSNRENAPETGYISFTQANNLYVLIDNKVVAVTENENEDIVSGQSVSRSEFGIYKGTFWSPDGTKLAYYVKDESEVTDYPIVNWNAKPAQVDMVKYPMAGAEGTEKVNLYVYDTKTRKSIQIQTGKPNTQYLTNIAWDLESEKIYIAHLNRDQNYMEMKRYDGTSGSFEKLLFTESDQEYVEPLSPPHFVPESKNLFVWESARSGFNHLYLYNTEGDLVRPLTKGNFEVITVHDFDAKGEKLFYTSTAISPLNRDLYSVSLKEGAPRLLTMENGTHAIKMSHSGKYFIDNFTSTTVPKRTDIINVQTKRTSTLLNSKNPLKDFSLGEMRMLTLKDKQGGDLYARMILPVGFDSTKTYPVVVYLYGGPHAQMVRNTWNGGGNLWFQYMAQQGYIVWTLDNRGSGNRGIAWEQSTFRELGTVEMEDQMQGIRYLKSKSYVDSERMGIHGWSFGGFMAISMMTRNPGVFKAGVAGGPVIDWSFYEIMYTERYMDGPEQNPEGYKNSNLFNYVKNLDGKLLIIHGTSDDVVVWQHSQLYLQNAVKAGKQIDYFVYPMHKHNVRGKDRTHLMQKVTDYLNDYIK